MSESATAVDAAQTGNSELRYGLGKAGWGIWVALVLFNFLGGMTAFTGIAIAGYALFCLVGSYVWVRVAKAILGYLGML